jgi:hypothetical protein
MAIWDVFSGRPGRQTAIWSNNQLSGIHGDAQKALSGGLDKSLASLGTAERGANTALSRGFESGAGALAGGHKAAVGNLNEADRYYRPLAAIADRGYGAYGDASGANGAAGHARATTNFRAGPGYQFMVDEALDGVARKAAALGMAGSGNTLQALSDRAGSMADQEWDDYLAGLNVYNTLAPQLANQRAGLKTHLADEATGYGRDRAGLRSGMATQQASLASGMGANRANLYSQSGNKLADLGVDIGRMNVGAGQAGMMAGQQASANALNAGLSLAQLGADMFGRSPAKSPL